MGQRCVHHAELSMCHPILVTTFPEWLSGTEPWPRTPSAAHPSSSCLKCVCVNMFSFAGLIRRTPPSTFSDTAITDRHSLFSRSEYTGCGYPSLLDRKNRSDMCRRCESNPRFPAWTASTLSTRPHAPLRALNQWISRVLSQRANEVEPTLY